MKIIIPMTGYGSRFVAAGYKELKPLIPVQGMPMIEWIVKGMYPGETDFLFVCREEHLCAVEGMRELLHRIAPIGDVFSVKNWRKMGPVCDVLRAEEKIPDDEACIVNYCDFYADWDYGTFCSDVKMRACDGCIPCYSGFHPHLLPEKNLYASCRTDEEGNLLEIREKYSFSEDKTKAKHSPGIYYFRTGALLKYYFRKQMEEGQNIGGEHYASLPYNFMVKDGLRVWVPVNIRHFCQWGTPEDLQSYLFWTEQTRWYER